MMYVDRKMHFEGPFGGLRKMLGVTRSPKNPNICNLCGYHWEAGRLAEVSVLFADCRGFTTLMEERGPEAVRSMVDLFFRRSREIVIGYDGIVDHFLGDAVMAFFNVPIHHDDHVAKAVRAAVDIQRATPETNKALGQDGLLKVGIGIATGLVATGTVGSSSCNDYTAVGNSVNLASRLQGAATPGEILVDGGAYEFVRA